MENKKYITVTQAAERLGVTPHYIRRLLNSGKLEGIRHTHNNTWKVLFKSFEDYRGSDLYKQDLAQLVKGFEITNKEAVENVESYYGDVISYISISGTPISFIDQNDCIMLDDLLFNMIPINKGNSGKKFSKITLFLHSGGGILEAAVKFIKIIRQYSNSFEVIVPMMAKSAATYMALSSDKLYLTRISELGPVDPIIQSPTNPGLHIPATAIQDFFRHYGGKFENDTENTLLQASLKKKFEDNLDPYLLGTFHGALLYAKEEIKGALTSSLMKNATEEEITDAIEEFTTKHHSHSYPIMIDILEKYKIGEIITHKDKLKTVKMLLNYYQQFMGMNNIVKLIGHRDENKIVQIIPQNNMPQPTQMNTNTLIK